MQDTILNKSRYKHLETMDLVNILVAPFVYSLGVLLLLVMALVYLLFGLQLFLTKLALLLFTSQSLDRLFGTDAAMLYAIAGADVLAVTQAAVVIRGRVDIAALQRHILENMVRGRNPTTGKLVNPKATKRVRRRWGYYVWEEEANFTIDQHVRKCDQCYRDDASLIKLIETIARAPLHQERALWELLLIPKMDIQEDEDSAPTKMDILKADECVLLFRVHHCLADGMNMLYIFTSLLDGALKPGRFQEMIHAMNLDKHSPLVKHNAALRYFLDTDVQLTFKTTVNLVLNAAAIGLSLPWHLASGILTKPDKIPFILHNNKYSGCPTMALSSHLDLRAFDDICAAFGCRTNDVFHFCMTNAIQRCSGASVPVATDAYITVAMPMIVCKPKRTWAQNGITLGLLRYPLQSPSQRQHVRAINKVREAAKSSAGTLLPFILSQYFGNSTTLPPSVLMLVSQGNNFSALATNIFGPTFDISFLGHKVTDMFTVPAIVCRAGVSFSLTTFNGGARVGIKLHHAVSQDDHLIQKLMNRFESILQELHALAKISLSHNKHKD